MARKPLYDKASGFETRLMVLNRAVRIAIVLVDCANRPEIKV